ncbi:precorrin-8X methylmutase [Sneathiella marina]|uniref:Precorrin-8X methylmutase n=1 Tax=Sneathiella marina TaxID=2950108 RepID=A0ABY4W522_9PROT|nr:precorrin-8X methylmutase [Sneathiella marina]USG62301.1 precorrin-8X methylmutase [Sneathiella marina]
MYDYLRAPQAIYEKSFATIRQEVDFSGMSDPMRSIATRIIHACGMPEILNELSFDDKVAEAAVAALRGGAPILSDCEMVTHGIIKRFLPKNNSVICTLNQPDVPTRAAEMHTTRSAAAIELWREHLEGSVAVFGNAPTALFHLLEIMEKGAPKPAAILGFPVGFVGAAESKTALAESTLNIPFVTLLGRKGGSAMAAAAVNAIARLAGEGT